jgi:hypothetical protein
LRGHYSLEMVSWALFRQLSRGPDYPVVNRLALVSLGTFEVWLTQVVQTGPEKLFRPVTRTVVKVIPIRSGQVHSVAGLNFETPDWATNVMTGLGFEKPHPLKLYSPRRRICTKHPQLHSLAGATASGPLMLSAPLTYENMRMLLGGRPSGSGGVLCRGM